MTDHPEWFSAVRRVVGDRRFVIAVAVVIMAVPTWFAVSTLITWNRISRVESDPDAATETLNSLLEEAAAKASGRCRSDRERQHPTETDPRRHDVPPHRLG